MDILCDTTDGDAKAKEAGAAIERDFGISPTLADDNDFSKKEAKLLKEFLSAEQVKKVQQVAKAYAQKEIKRATYQAMEAFVHNLNTMHSRAGAQIPFSSIN